MIARHVIGALCLAASAPAIGVDAPEPIPTSHVRRHSEMEAQLTRTASDTVRELVDRVTRLRNGDVSQIERLADLYAVQAHVTHPFHPEQAGSTTIGRESLQVHFARLPQAGVSVTSSVEDLKLHTTADPEVVIVEFRYAGLVDQRPLNTRCIFVVRVVAGRIVESRDYIDHLASARAYGMLPEVLARISSGVK
jgi:uncharacterized protein